MRLHSDFHDYYDHAIGYGVDEKVHYNRIVSEADIRIHSFAEGPLHSRSGILGFCGTLYPFIKVSRYDKKHDCDWVDEFDGRIIEEFCAFSYGEYREKEDQWYEYSDDFGYPGHSSEVRLKQFFLDWRREDDSIFLEFKVPVWRMRFYSRGHNGILNPSLKEMGFDRIKDPVTAFQEVSMYLANILIEQKPVAEVDDKHRIEQHGFDLKTSFRNTKKKK